MSLVGKKLWSEDFVSTFVKDFIKHDVLIEAYLKGWKGTKVEKLHQSVALYCLTRETGLKLEESVMIKMCIKLCFSLLSRMRHLVKRCKARGWPAEKALLLGPMWLRTAETKLRLLPAAIKLESNFEFAPNSKVTTFNAKLLENATQAVKNGKAIYDPEVVGDLGKCYNVDDESILQLWKRTCTNMRNHIIAMCQAGDSPQRMFTTDWRIADLLLRNDFSFRIITKESLSHLGQLQGLLELYKIIVKKNVEEITRSKSPDLIQAWVNVYAAYSYSGTNTSLILLQRRWYELKLEARSQVLSYWADRHGGPVPHQLLLSIVSNFRHVILEPFPSWPELVKSGQVVEMEDVSQELYSIAMQEAQEECGGELSPCVCIDDCDSECDKETKKLRVGYVHISSDEDEPLSVINDSTSSKDMYKDIVSKEIEESNEETNVQEIFVQNKYEEAKDEDKSKRTESLLHKEMNAKDETETEVDPNIDMLNTMDPSKAQIKLIFDSDSEYEDIISNDTTSNSTSGISNKDKNLIVWSNYNTKANDLLQACDTRTNDIVSLDEDLRQSSQENIITETSIGTSLKTVSKEKRKNRENTGKKSNGENIESMDVVDQPVTGKTNDSNEPDHKLLMDAVVPLVRCDLTPYWKRYSRNNTINIRNVHEDNLHTLKPKPKNRPIAKSVANRVYSARALINNPDFNLSVKSLSQRFLSYMRNRRLLNACKPVTVDVERLPPMSAVQKSSADTCLRRTARKIELQNIEDVRKINKTILTAQVAPITTDSAVKCYYMVLGASKTSAGSGGRTPDVTSEGDKRDRDQTPKTKGVVTDAFAADPNTPSHGELKSLLRNLWTRVNATPSKTGAKVTRDDSMSAENKSSRACGCGSVTFTQYQGDEVTDMRKKYHEQFIMEEKILSKDIYKLLKNKSQVTVQTSNVKDDNAHVEQMDKKEVSKIVNEDKREQSVHGVEITESVLEGDNDSSNVKVTDDKMSNINVAAAHGNISESDNENIKLSTVVENLRKKKKRRGRKRKKNQEEKDSCLIKGKQKKNKMRSNLNEKPTEPCQDEYQEWVRQKSLGLQYFNIPMTATEYKKRAPRSSKRKKSTKELEKTDIVASETSQESNKAENYCNRNQQKSYFVRFTGRSLLRKDLHKINAASTSVIDLTKTPDGQSTEGVVVPDSRLSTITIERNSNATYTLASIGTLPIDNNTSSENTPKVFNTNDAASPSSDGASECFSPIITGVCSLANTQFVEETDHHNVNPTPIATHSNSSIIIQPMLFVSETMPQPSLHQIPTPELVNPTPQVEHLRFTPVSSPTMKPTPLTISSVQSLPAQHSNSMQYDTLKHVLVPGQTAASQIPPSLQTSPIRSIHTTPTGSQDAVPTSNGTNTIPFVNIGTVKSNSVIAGHHRELQSGPSTDVSLTNIRPSEPPVGSPGLETTSKRRPMSSTPCIPAALWAHRRSRNTLSMMRLDAAQKLWTLDERLILTELDIPCEKPEYWTIAPEMLRIRILFPGEKDGTHLFDPVSIHINENTVNDDTPFGKWVKSVINPKRDTSAEGPSHAAWHVANDNTAENETAAKEVPDDGSNTVTTDMDDTVKNVKRDNVGGPSRPTPRLKVKSFARLEDDEIHGLTAPERVCVRGKLYQKMSDQPLTYAKVLTVVSNRRQSSNLLSMKVPLYVLSPTSRSLTPLKLKPDPNPRPKARPPFFVRASNAGTIDRLRY